MSHLLSRLGEFYIHGWAGLLRSLGIATLAVLAVMLVELCFVPWPQSSMRQALRWSRSTRTDLLAFLLVETNVGLFLGMLMFLGITYGAQKAVLGMSASVGRLGLAGPLLSAAVFILVIDLANYWTHRWCHVVPLLWQFHRYHHSAPEMTVLTAARDHPLERAFSALIVLVPATFLQVPAYDLVYVHLAGKLIGLFKHSNIHSNWGVVGRYLIQSPAAHRVHHSSAPEHHNVNYASIFQWWDVVFGSALHPTRDMSRGVRLGVEGDDGQTPPLRYLLQIYRGFLMQLAGSVGKRHA